MAAKRINITVDEEMLEGIDATAKSYGMNRSECIAYAFELLEELNAWNVLENVALDASDKPYYKPTKYAISKAARKCSVTRDED